MRSLLVLCALLVAGCLDAAAPAATTEPPAAAGEPQTLEGRVWLPSSEGSDRMETLVPIPDVATGARLVARVALGGTYLVETPPVLADVRVELRDPAGEVLAEAGLDAAAPEATLEAHVPAAGEAGLALLSYGGSDGSSAGDRVDYRIDVSYAT